MNQNLPIPVIFGSYNSENDTFHCIAQAQPNCRCTAHKKQYFILFILFKNFGEHIIQNEN